MHQIAGSLEGRSQASPLAGGVDNKERIRSTDRGDHIENSKDRKKRKERLEGEKRSKACSWAGSVE